MINSGWENQKPGFNEVRLFISVMELSRMSPGFLTRACVFKKSIIQWGDKIRQKI
ncbi:MAG TPA: hypothetical protein V6C58_09765 [Allocoleopsis sp.]